MFQVKRETQFLIILFIIVSVFLWYYKPSIMFNGNKMKKFGIGGNKTVFSYPIVLIVIAILMFYILEVITLKKNNFL